MNHNFFCVQSHTIDFRLEVCPCRIFQALALLRQHDSNLGPARPGPAIFFSNFGSNSLHCKNFPKRYAWLSVHSWILYVLIRLLEISGFFPENISDFRNLVDLNE